jgi:cobalt/nickel transport system ATP-binding protein
MIEGLTNVVEVDDVTFSYEGAAKPSLDHVTVNIKKGVKTVILGSNGAGKSTLFYQFNAVEKPDSGQVRVMGQPAKYRGKRLKEIRSQIAVVLQNPDDQVFCSTVEDDVGYGPRNMKLPPEEIKERVDKALFETGLTEFREKNTLQLSYGQRKRLALAGALAMRPEVLVMDEPTAGLDPQMALELMELAEQLHNNGTTIVISTHDVDLAYAWADEIHVLRKAELIYSGPSEGFYCDGMKVHSTGVMPPSMFVMNKNLADIRGEDPAPYPRTESQLLSKMVSGPKGRLHIVPVTDKVDHYMMDPVLEHTDDVKVGVFGTVTRRLLYASQMPADFVFNGFESCVGRCLRGKDAALLCDADCVNLIEAKIADLRQFGTDLEYKVYPRTRESSRGGGAVLPPLGLNPF